jgi:hypothetical protein
VKNLTSRIQSFTIDPSKRQDANFSDGRQKLLGRSLARTKEKFYLFAIS